MGQLTQDDKLHIKRLTEKFTNAALGSAPPNNMCFSICYALSLYLENNNVGNDIVTGNFRPTSVAHFWLKLREDRTAIVDATIRQFYPDMPSVHVGERPEDYDECTHDNWFEQYVLLWKEPLLVGPAYDMLPQRVRQNSPYQNKFDFKRFLEVNLRAATILNNEMQQCKIGISFNQSSNCEIYFSHICEIVRKYSGSGELQELNLPPEFDQLIFKCELQAAK